jgi:CRP-like cAMP-binding protein
MDQKDRSPAAVGADQVKPIGVFAGLSAQAMDHCASRAGQRQLRKGEAIFHQGDRPARFHALHSGWVRVMQTGRNGELSVIRFVGPGELFGSFAIFTGDGYPADATAIMDSVELSWSEADLRQLIDRHPEIALNLVTLAAGRLAELQERMREISTQHAEQRIANTLLRLARKGGQRSADGGIDILLPLLRKDIAAMSATTLHTASRVLSAWRRRGLISGAAGRLSILRPPALERIAEGA